MRLSTSAFVVAAVTLLAGSARAHHNMSALFDFNDRVTVSGTLTRLDWRNPHIYVFVDGKTGANQTEVKGWSIEGPPPSFFRARENDAPGSGLGWSIVRRIALALNLEVTIDRAPELGGLRVRVSWMPAESGAVAALRHEFELPLPARRQPTVLESSHPVALRR